MTEQSCSQDSDCPESSKCCDCGCVRRCTPVSSDKLGMDNRLTAADFRSFKSLQKRPAYFIIHEKGFVKENTLCRVPLFSPTYCRLRLVRNTDW